MRLIWVNTHKMLRTQVGTQKGHNKWIGGFRTCSHLSFENTYCPWKQRRVSTLPLFIYFTNNSVSYAKHKTSLVL